jgi:hypothetical protein
MKQGPIFTKAIPTETNRLFNTVTPVTPQSAVVDKIDSQFSKKDLEMRGGEIVKIIDDALHMSNAPQMVSWTLLTLEYM